MQISAACSDYCHALCNPFDAKPCGVPLAPIVNTQKTRVYVKGTASTGIGGVGFVSARPGHGGSNTSTAVFYTDSSYQGSTVQNTSGPGVNPGSTNSPYSSANFGPGATDLSFRIVSFGLRARYIGTELNRGGSKICLVDPTHNATDGRDEAQLLAEPQARKLPVSREWVNLHWQPITTDEYGFSSTDFGSAYMTIMFVSPDASINLPFEFEAYGIYEFQGSVARAQTHTFADPVGFAAVQTVSAQMNSISHGSASRTANEMHKLVHHYVNSGVSGVRGIAETASTAAAGVSSAWTILSDIFEMAAPILAFL